jgi:hypothetical protein
MSTELDFRQTRQAFSISHHNHHIHTTYGTHQSYYLNQKTLSLGILGLSGKLSTQFYAKVEL